MIPNNVFTQTTYFKHVFNHERFERVDRVKHAGLVITEADEIYISYKKEVMKINGKK